MALDKIYICHHIPLIERKELLIEKLNNYNNIMWVENFLPNDIQEDLKHIHEKFKQIDEPYEIIHPYGSYYAKYKKISISEYSLYLKHKYAIKDAIDNNYQYILILEDDVLIRSDFENYLNKNFLEFDEYVNEINANILMMGVSHNRFYKGEFMPNKNVYFNELQKTRCAHAILYNKNCLSIIYDEIENIDNPFDFKLDYIIQNHNLKVCWSEPGLFQNKKYKSSVQI